MEENGDIIMIRFVKDARLKSLELLVGKRKPLKAFEQGKNCILILIEYQNNLSAA